MDENKSESPRPLAFTIDFGEGKSVDTQRHKTLVEKYQKRHKRGQSLSKLEDSPVEKPKTGPRKSGFQSDGSFSSDEKSERMKLKLPLKNAITESFSGLPSISSPDIELKDVSSPEMDLMSPYSPKTRNKVVKQNSSPEIEERFVDGAEFDFDRSDTVSDAGTYTLDTDNYSEEQKARMSIDKEFKIEKVSVLKRTQDYIQSLSNQGKSKPLRSLSAGTRRLNLSDKTPILPSSSPVSPTTPTTFLFKPNKPEKTKTLSPILSPTQNISIENTKPTNNDKDDLHNKTFTKIMFPSPKSKMDGLEHSFDQGSVISVTSSGAFRSKVERNRGHISLTKSEIHVEAYTGERDEVVLRQKPVNLSTSLVNVQSIHARTPESDASLIYALEKVSNLPPSGVSGKSSPSKIPSPVQNVSRPRSRNSISSLNIDLSDSSLETESYLKPTQNYIMTLEKRLPLDTDHDSDFDSKYNNVPLNNDTRNLLKQKLTHVRHNSFDDRNLKVMNKLEHFQNKNLQGIDQTSKMLNQYPKVVHKIQNSPNNSPIRRSSSFSNRKAPKNTNLQKESNLRNSPNFTRNGPIQRSASTANIKPSTYQFRRSSINSDHKIDRSQFGDTESSSEEDFDRTFQKKKDLANITNTKCNRAFALRRARLDAEPPPKCPNTPEMRRKFQPERPERAISMDRKSAAKTSEVQSRYLLNLSRKSATPKAEAQKSVPKTMTGGKMTPAKQQVFARTDTGRFSMRASPKPISSVPKNLKKDGKSLFISL